MVLELISAYRIWIIVLIVLAVCWPIAQSLRHKNLHPFAAYLLFVSVLGLVSALVFWSLLFVGSALVGPAGMEGAGPAAIIILLSVVSGFAAARWIVRRPQVRRMPK
ncbi:hypothetical protein [Yoonia sp.]|uniref:hypothetical protein n=1 Tax=Yoonia sp. TaxID=2212373 RepID=UPI003F6CC33E